MRLLIIISSAFVVSIDLPFPLGFFLDLSKSFLLKNGFMFDDVIIGVLVFVHLDFVGELFCQFGRNHNLFLFFESFFYLGEVVFLL